MVSLPFREVLVHLKNFFEMLTWAQLGLHRKPVAFLNVDGFYDALLALVDTMVDRGFLRKEKQGNASGQRQYRRPAG